MPADKSNPSGAGPAPSAGTASESRVLQLESEIRTLKEAVRTRTLTGTAIGILAERYGCTSEQAWALIGRVSSHTNIKARDVARIVVASADGSDDAGDRVLLETLAPHLPGLVRDRTRHVATPAPRSTRASVPTEGTTT